jgi:hypothetical protein
VFRCRVIGRLGRGGAGRCQQLQHVAYGKRLRQPFRRHWWCDLHAGIVGRETLPYRESVQTAHRAHGPRRGRGGQRRMRRVSLPQRGKERRDPALRDGREIWNGRRG